MRRSWALVLIGVALAFVSIFLDPSAVWPSLARSWFFAPARVADLRIALGTIGVLVALAPWWLAFLARDPNVAADVESGPAKSRRFSRAVDALFIAALIASAASLWSREDPMSKDTKFYLGEALDIAQHGGVPDLCERCFAGTWQEDNRHPLYLALLAPWASASNAFLVRARLVSLAGGLLTLWLCLRACRRRGGESAAIVGGALLVTNASFVEHSILVACESWWTACAVLAFDVATGEGRRPWVKWGSVGALIGLAFLAKGTGLLFLIACAIWIVLSERRHAWKPLCFVGIGFIAGALPLLVRNQRLFGDALWNVNSRHAFWLDHWEQFFDPEAMRTASASHYFATHSLGEMAVRLGNGAAKMFVHALEACAPFSPSAAFGAPMLILLIAGVVATRERKSRAFLGILAALWFASFAWYAQIASDRRFLAVLLPVALPAIVAWTSRLRAREWTLARSLGLVVAVAVTTIGALRGRQILRALEFEPAPWNDALKDYLRERTREDPDAIYFLGPSSSVGFDWDRSLLATRHARPIDEAEFERWSRESESSRFRYLVVEADDAAHRYGAAWVARGAGEGLHATAVPPGWKQVAAFPPEAPHALVFERN